MPFPDEDDAAATPSQPNPRAKLMEEVAAQMDAIEADFPDGYEIGRVITIAEVRQPGGGIELRIRAGMYPWVAVGILDWAKKSLEATPLE